MSGSLPTLLFSAALVGLLGAGHCVAMCSGFAAIAAGGEPDVATSKLTRRASRAPRPITMVVAENAGRLVGYASLGVVLGTLGGAAGTLLTRGRATLELLSALLLVGVGLFLVGLLPAFARLEGGAARLFRRVAPLARRLLPLRTVRDAALFGVLWGLLPCGLVTTALALAAVSGTPLGGALVMLAFGTGTLPAVLALGVLADTVRRLTAQRLVRISLGILMVGMGVAHLATASTSFVGG